jgi:D-amino-acid dehydrogenase
MAEILVLGAGMVGVSTALALQARGHAVTLADRRDPGLETSYGNAGVIQVEAAEPYPMPRDLLTLARMAFGRGNDMVYSPAGLLRQSGALWRYFLASGQRRHKVVSQVYSQLTARATADHQPLITASGSENLIARDGLALLFRDAAGFDAAARAAEHLRATYGVASRAVDGAAWRREEPALRLTPAGAVHYTGSWSASDPGGLTAAYAALFERQGGRILIADAQTLVRSSSGWQIDGPDGPVTAEAAVLCLGPWTGSYLRRFDLRVPMVLKRGYHAHYDAPLRPRRPFMDADNGVVLSPMTRGLRMASGAALVPMDSAADPRQLRRAEAAVGAMIELGPRLEEPQWVGTRPCLPGMLPMVGAIPAHPGLWVNFGHGHQGFTLGPTTATLLADAFEGAPSELQKALSPAVQMI